MKIDLVDNYNKYYGQINPAVAMTPELHVVKQVAPEIDVTPKDSYQISFAAQERARVHNQTASLQKLAHQVQQKIMAHAEHVKVN